MRADADCGNNQASTRWQRHGINHISGALARNIWHHIGISA